MWSRTWYVTYLRQRSDGDIAIRLNFRPSSVSPPSVLDFKGRKEVSVVLNPIHAVREGKGEIVGTGVSLGCLYLVLAHDCCGVLVVGGGSGFEFNSALRRLKVKQRIRVLDAHKVGELGLKDGETGGLGGAS